jgi:glycosyltransferase involved in cell wall biosynthesis
MNQSAEVSRPALKTKGKGRANRPRIARPKLVPIKGFDPDKIQKNWPIFVSVIIPTCNDDLRLEWSLEGLCRQDVKNFEIIVVNDDGPSTTETLVRKFQARLNITYHHFGVPKRAQRAGATRNFGARFSVGDLLLFLDTDVVPDSDLVSAHCAHFDPKVALFGYRRHFPMELVRPFTPPLDYEELYRHSIIDRRLFGYTQWSHPQMFLHFFGCNYSIPAKMFCDLGGHDERYEGWGGEDIDLGYRIVMSGYEIYPLWGIGMGTHLDHVERPLPTHEQPWHCSKDEPLCRNGGPLIRYHCREMAL